MTTGPNARQKATNSLRSMVISIVQTLQLPRIVFGVVTAVATPTISVKLSGTTVTTTGVRHLNSYLPLVNDTVVCVLVATDLWAVGHIGTSRTAFTPSGAAGGTLGGTYPNPIVKKLRGVLLGTTGPSAGYTLVATSSTAAKWVRLLASQVLNAATKITTALQSFVAKIKAAAFTATSGVFSRATSGVIALRPNGPTSTTGQVTIGTTGTVTTPATLLATTGTVEGTTLVTKSGKIAKLAAGILSLRPNGVASTTGEVTIGTTGLVKISSGGSFVTTTAVVFSTVTPASGTAFTPSATKNTNVLFTITGSGTTKVTGGPSTGAETVLFTSMTLSAGLLSGSNSNAITISNFPAGYKIVITFSGGTRKHVAVYTC